MRLHRRAALGLGLGGIGALGVLGPVGARAEPRGGAPARPIVVDAKPIPAFAPRDPARRRFGSLTYRSGLVLTSGDPGFGGWSGLWRSPDGAQLVSLSDRGDWLTASPAYGDVPRLSGLRDVVIAPVLGADGRPLGQEPAYDTEALAIADGVAYVASERTHELRRFATWGRDGVKARGQLVPVLPEMRTLPSNESLEAVGVPPPGHPLAGSVIAIAERAQAGDDAPTRGWVLLGPRRFAFDVARSNAFDITDLAFLPSGEALLLERRFRLVSGVACRIRRLAADAFQPDRPVDGEVIFEVDRAYEVDNMEGIAVHRDHASGETVVTLISDDNFSFLQRTLLLEFALGA